MKMRSFLYMWPVFFALPAGPRVDDVIRVKVSIAEAVVAPQADAGQVLQLTDLEYAIEVETRCESGSTPASLSIGVADTRHHLRFAQADNPARLSATFVVPGRQLAPVVTTGYCIAEDPDSMRTLLIPEAFTAQLSLSCQSGGTRSMHYLSQPLSVRLVCTPPDEDQDSSPDSTR